ncbi:hypothetical protein L917_12783 [Phytophthora nicotianae]|uniref:START domain-containing protein n=1 Tax=Phytophthora nicotianae TaxID=4792 RepID=W2KU67_PHYNI|nr:hypothetical protein L917_12783 [Phytophthora nicotianae]
MESQLETTNASPLLVESGGQLSARIRTSLITDVPESTTQNNQKSRATVRSRTYRLGQKMIRDDLRRQEVELRQQLLSLRREIKAKSVGPNASGYMAFLLWRDLAARLQQEREDAETQQQELRVMANRQAMYISALRDIVTKKIGDPIISPFTMEPVAPFSKYIQQLETSFHQTDEVFRADYKHEADKRFYVRSRLVLPSSLSEANSVMWQLGQQHFRDSQDYMGYDIDDPKRTIVTNFRDTNVLETGETFQLSRWCIVRQFVQDDHIVNTWKCISEGGGIFSGIKVDERGWCRLYSSEDVMEPGTVVEMCVHRVPIHTGNPTPQESIVDTFHNLLQKISQETLVNLVANLESVVLEKALTNIS